MKEILKDLVESITLPEDGYLEQDQEILEIFVEEIEEIFEELDPLLGVWLENPTDQEALKTIRRHFHTLKGSGRMVGARTSGEVAWTVEDLLNRIIAGQVKFSPEIAQYVSSVYQVYKHKLYPAFKDVEATSLDLRPLVLLGQNLQQEQSPEPALECLFKLGNTVTSAESVTGLEIQLEVPVTEYAIDVSESFVETTIQFEEVEQDTSDTDQENHKFAEDSFLEETIEIFIEESEEHLTTIDLLLTTGDIKEKEYNDLIRAIHTLRGSSTMVHLDQVFDASTKVETLFKAIIEGEVELSHREMSALFEYSEFVRDYLDALTKKSKERQDQLYSKFISTWSEYGFEEGYAVSVRAQGLVSKLIDLNIEELLDAEYEFEKFARDESYLIKLVQQAQILADGTDIKIAEGVNFFAKELKAAYEGLIKKPQLLNSEYAFEIFANVHQILIDLFDTLASGQRVNLTNETQACLQELSKFILQDIEAVDEIENTSLNDELVEITPVVSFSSGSVNFAEISQRIASDRHIEDDENTHRDFDSDLIDIFLEEAEELLVDVNVAVDEWSKDFDNTGALNNLMRYLHTLKGGANMISAKNIGLITHNLESIYERLINNQIEATPALISIIRLVQDDVSDRIQLIRDEAIDYPATETIKILQNITVLAKGQMLEESSVETDIEDVTSNIVEPELAEVLSAEGLEEPLFIDVPIDVTASVDEMQFTVDERQPLESESLFSEPEIVTVETTAFDFDASIEILAKNSADIPLKLTDTKEKVESELYSVEKSDDESLHAIVEESFHEEAQELLENMEQLVYQWIDQRGNRSILLQLQRSVHSLKGGARMLDLDQVSTVTYLLENAFEQFAFHQFNSNAYDGLLFTAIAWMKQAIFKADYTNFESLTVNLEAMQFIDVTAQLPTNVTQIDILDTTAHLEFVQGDGSEPPSMLGEWEDSGQTDNNNEMIRISADLVEKMIDLSGENSITRSRVEMELGQFVGTLNEMELAIQRLADQLRRMDGELESQIIAKHGSENSRYADFDPLEMDQYSSLNQLSKSLAESASDLVDFKTTLADKIRDAESLLIHQSRIQSEIQESLMRTRLVPFSRLLPRLQRIVRQTSTSLNRPTELVVHNTEGELDRTILERLVTPFEHMLRNAIDHGIENTEDRIANNKPESGTIELNISRQGTDVIVTFSDDGKGIDANSIKEKALNLGLISQDQHLEQQEILQFIFHPGFSTAKEVTQISGRGVGLDVVQTEIKSLGGYVSLESTLGKGTTFTIRVPTTVAISDALMVKAGDQQFALPLAQIERIVRIAPTELEKFFNGKSEFFKIDNESYKLRYISEFITNQAIPRLASVGHSLPVLLIKGSAGQTIALLVDQLVGSRNQIVVKPIGQQFAKVSAIAGATIMGDGHVCLILDSQNIARQIQSTKRQTMNKKKRDQNRDRARNLIMIVDDSVTVRKVTTRLLERQGYDVVTAKDGVDAVEQLENVKPDLMLLDIEMPRMDGFEVTNHVRHHELHQELPIVMITSRTGEKHRERAFSLGVTHYMGKPFQEVELLENIQGLLSEHQG